MAQHALVFDTLQSAKRLQKAGFTEVQAEAQVEIIKEQAEAFNDLIDNSLATKTDIKSLEERIVSLEERIALSEERTSERIANMSYKIIISLGSMIAAGVAVLGFLLKSH